MPDINALYFMQYAINGFVYMVTSIRRGSLMKEKNNLLYTIRGGGSIISYINTL